MTFYDPIRCKEVADTPEERVRQSLLRQMLESLAYPKGLISVEKKIAKTLRRVDVVVYTPRKESLKPLLLVECKASDLEEEAAFRQVSGYRSSCPAPFWGLAHNKGFHTFWLQGETVHSVPFLPSYPELLATLS